MSKLEVDKIDPQSGTDLELGTSGDTITIPAGVTFDSSAATNTLPSTVVTTTGSQTLTNKSIVASQLTGTIATSNLGTGTADATTFLRGDNTFAAAGGGITETDQWRLTVNLTNPGTADITANLERVDDASFAKIGTGMTESSGIFSFPSTGLYCVNYKVSTQSTTDFHTASIYVTSDGGSTYDEVTETFFGHNVTGLLKQDAFSQALINVTNISNIKVKFSIEGLTIGTMLGATTVNKTAFSFFRLGDSQ